LSTLPKTAFLTQLVIELWLTPTNRSVDRCPTPSMYCANAAAFFSGGTTRRFFSPKVVPQSQQRNRWRP